MRSIRCWELLAWKLETQRTCWVLLAGQNPSYHAPGVYRLCRDYMHLWLNKPFMAFDLLVQSRFMEVHGGRHVYLLLQAIYFLKSRKLLVVASEEKGLAPGRCPTLDCSAQPNRHSLRTRSQRSSCPHSQP